MTTLAGRWPPQIVATHWQGARVLVMIDTGLQTPLDRWTNEGGRDDAQPAGRRSMSRH